MAEQKTSASAARQPSTDDIVNAMLPLIESSGDIPIPDSSAEVEAQDQKALEVLYAIGVPSKLSRLAEVWAALEVVNRTASNPRSGGACMALHAIDRAMVSTEAQDVADLQARIWWLEQDGNWDLGFVEDKMPDVLRFDVWRVMGRPAATEEQAADAELRRPFILSQGEELARLWRDDLPQAEVEAAIRDTKPETLECAAVQLMLAIGNTNAALDGEGHNEPLLLELKGLLQSVLRFLVEETGFDIEAMGASFYGASVEEPTAG